MGDNQLGGMSFSLSHDVEKLEGELAETGKRQSEALAKLRGRLAKFTSAGEKRQSDLSREHAKISGEHASEQEKLTSAGDSAVAFGLEAIAEQHEMQRLQGMLASKLWAAARCHPCAALQDTGLRDAASMVSTATAVSKDALLISQQAFTYHGRAPYDGVEHEKLVRKVEGIQDKRAQLQQDQTKEVTDYLATQRELLDQIDALGAKLRIQEAANQQATYVLHSRGERLEGHRGAVGRYKEGQSGILARLKSSTSTLTAKLKALDRAMQRCGC